MTIDLHRFLERMGRERQRLQKELAEAETPGMNVTLARIVRLLVLETKVEVYKGIMQAAVDSSNVSNEEYNQLYDKFDLRP